MTDLDIDAIEQNFRTNPEVVAVCQLAREQRAIIKARTEHIEWLEAHDRLMGDTDELGRYKAAWKQANRMFRSHAKVCAAWGEVFRPCGKCTIDAIATKHGLETQQAGEKE